MNASSALRLLPSGAWRRVKWYTFTNVWEESSTWTSGQVKSKVKWSYPRNRLWRPVGLCDVEDPTLSSQSAHRWRQDCQHCAPAALYSPETLLLLYFCYSFLLEAEWTPGSSDAGRIRWSSGYLLLRAGKYLPDYRVSSARRQCWLALLSHPQVFRPISICWGANLSHSFLVNKAVCVLST
jgi:hypothetical protein